MAKTVVRNGRRCWIDAEGTEIPVSIIDKNVKDCDSLVGKVFKRVGKVKTVVEKEKEVISKDVQAHLQKIAESYGEKWQGNAELCNFDDTQKVRVHIQKTMEFDEKLQIAKTKIDQCINAWAKDSKPQLSVLVKEAFNVDTKGQVNTKQVLSLRRYKIKDKPWLEAMEIIGAAAKVVASKTYYTFYEKDSSGEWKPVVLNFSKM